MTPYPKKQPKRPVREKGEFSEGTVVAIWDRDRGLCAWCGGRIVGKRGGFNWAVHHRRPRSVGGTSEMYVARPSNGVLLHAKCHDEIESNREDSTKRGFLVSANGIARPRDVAIVHAVHGLVRLDDDGHYAKVTA